MNIIIVVFKRAVMYLCLLNYWYSHIYTVLAYPIEWSSPGSLSNLGIKWALPVNIRESRGLEVFVTMTIV